MSAGKWIGGILGFMSGGALGALAGVALGALFDYGLKAVNTGEDRKADGFSGFGDAWEEARRRQYYEGQRNSFLFSLLVLASYIIRADGKVMHSEMEFVRRFLRINFGEAAVEQGNGILLRLFDEQKRMEAGRPGAFKNVIRESCAQIAANMDYSQRLQLLNFLVMLAQADGSVVVNPLVPKDTWTYFCLDNVNYRGDVLTIIYDKDGQRYHQGKGLRLLVNGKLAAQREDLGKLTYKK